jgi:plastocyanin domain-containing protein
MNGIDWLMILGGLGAAGWVNWYFFFAGRQAVVAVPTGNAASPSHVTIAVLGGYSPSRIRVAAGRPVQLEFDRQETSSCSEEIVFPDFGIRKFLPAHQKTTITITPPAPGTYEFTCGMSMLRGRVIAE